MKIMTCFIDTSAWLAVIDNTHSNHAAAADYFRQLLEDDAKLISNNAVVDQVLEYLKEERNAELARQFINIIDESVLTVNLRMDWISRRVRRASINQYLKSGESGLKLHHFYVNETLKRKRVDIIFSFDASLKRFGLPLMPQTV